VLDQIPGHPWHVRWFPSEDVSVSPKEADERVFLFRVKAATPAFLAPNKSPNKSHVFSKLSS
jgi:hypothetical protein